MAPMIEDDFITTISDDDISDEEQEIEAPSEEKLVSSTKRKRSDANPQSKSNKKRKANQTTKSSENAVEEDDGVDKDSDMLSDFEFDNSDRTAALGDFDGWAIEGDKAAGTESMVDIDALVARRREKGATKNTAVDSDDEAEDDGDDDDSEGDEDEDEELADSDSSAELYQDAVEQVDVDQDEDEDENAAEDSDDEHNAIADPMPEAADDDDDDADDVSVVEDKEEAAKSRAFFAEEKDTPALVGEASFATMNLSRPILKGLSGVGFSKPTPIQAKAIPVALEGKDIVGGAVTGSGKTGAFMLPILERLLYRPKRVATTRVAILMPTRELALQCLTVAKKLAAYTDITFGRAIGGLNSREQEKELKLRPDVVIATPGRFIDFMRNSTALEVDKIEILVLDEADRMLEDGFADELNEILNTIPKSRQTMLFSATMTSRIDDLVRAGLQRPVRLMVDAQKASASGLVQEFVRLRPGRESKRLGYLLYLCANIHTDRVIIFFRQKKEAHRVRVIFALCGLKAAELHGSMSQEQRITAIESFRSGRASFLLATDLASRGLDIKGIDTVINYEAPQTHEIYLHRVGRTARAGRKGVSCTLAAEPDRRVIKAAVKAGKAHGASIRQRTVDPKDADEWQKRCDDLADEVEAVLREEKEERVLQQTERSIQRAENVVKYEDEIKSRPKKTWFASEQEKTAAKQRGAELLNGPRAVEVEGKRNNKGGKLSNKKKKQLEDRDDRREGREWKKGKAMRGVGGKAMKEMLGSSGKKKSKSASTGKKPKGGKVGKR